MESQPKQSCYQLNITCGPGGCSKDTRYNYGTIEKVFEALREEMTDCIYLFCCYGCRIVLRVFTDGKIVQEISLNERIKMIIGDVCIAVGRKSKKVVGKEDEDGYGYGYGYEDDSDWYDYETGRKIQLRMFSSYAEYIRFLTCYYEEENISFIPTFDHQLSEELIDIEPEPEDPDDMGKYCELAEEAEREQLGFEIKKEIYIDYPDVPDLAGTTIQLSDNWYGQHDFG